MARGRLQVAFWLGSLVVLAGLADASPAQGHLALPESATLSGALVVDARDAALELSPDVEAGHAVAISWEQAQGERVARAQDEYGIGPEYVQGTTQQPTNESLAFARGNLTGLACRDECAVLLVSEGGNLTLGGLAAGPLAWRTDAQTYWSGSSTPGASDSFLHVVPPGTLQVGGRAGSATLPLANATLHLQGDFLLYLWSADGVVTDASGAHPLDTGARVGPMPATAGVSPGIRRESAFVALHLRGARLDLPEGALARLMAGSLDASLSGALDAPRAFGELRAGGARRGLDGESLRVEGALRLAASANPSTTPFLGRSQDRGVLDVALSGDATRVLVDGAAWSAASAPSPGVWAARAAALAMLGALATRLAAGVPFYTRLERASIMRNANRRALFDAICASPGATNADLARATGMAEVVVRHHLRMLERHQMVVLRAAGHRRMWFPVGAAASPEAVAVKAALRDESRAQVARALAGGAALTQKQIGERTGLSQRVVSYHLTHLEGEGLVVDDGRMPRRYSASARLREEMPADAGASAA